MTPKEILEKATMIVTDLSSDGGYLNPEQANRFILDVQDQPTLLNEIRVVPMNSPQRIIENIGFGSRILHVAPAATAAGGTALGSGDRSQPSTGKIVLTTKEVIAEVNIPYDVLEDNIERGGLEDTIMGMITARVSLDLDELLVLGDVDDGADDYIKLFDGIVEMATKADPSGAGTGGTLYHTVGVGTASAMGRHVFKLAIKTMPNKYLRNRQAMRFYVSPNNELDYRDTVADRQTGLGDQTVQRWQPLTPFGVPLVPATFIPDTTCAFVDPLNIIMGIQRDILIETDRIIRERVIVIVVTLRIAIACETRDALVTITGIGL